MVVERVPVDSERRNEVGYANTGEGRGSDRLDERFDDSLLRVFFRPSASPIQLSVLHDTFELISFKVYKLSKWNRAHYQNA